ncbi:MAG TPA: phosphatase PAP2 family protein [Candidatus Woesebacteria bacterium]|nr:phosphatase PAP2 family protein [Candidatus Woesebacteria bacterium]
MIKKLLFWQPKKNFYQQIIGLKHGQFILLFSNYIIWVYLFFISFLLIRFDKNLFWQILIATILSEVIEKYLKIKNFWRRPAFSQDTHVPQGLIKSWYLKGSFPSGHTIKAVFFLLFVITTSVYSPILFIFITSLLILFRVVIGFHYPIDVFGGIIIGTLIWWLSTFIIMPPVINHLIELVFNFVFFIK